MNKRIIELADKAVEDISSGHWNIPDEFCKKFAALVAAHEREECAKIAEIAEPYQAADLIRARSNT
jgi:hypothetical protein